MQKYYLCKTNKKYQFIDYIKLVIGETETSRTDIKVFMKVEFTEFNVMDTKNSVKLTIIYDKIFIFSFLSK